MRKSTSCKFTLSLFDGKKCSHCNQWRFFSDFHKSKRTTDGTNGHCKYCQQAYKAVHIVVHIQIFEKKCAACRQTKPASEFHKASNTLDGLACYCKICNKKRANDYYHANVARVSISKKPVQKKYRETKKDALRQQLTEWRRKNRAAYLAQKARRRARELGAEGHFTGQEWNDLCAFYGNVCLACGKAVRLTVDHIVPLSEGGSNWITNTQPLCKPCNSSKGTRTINYRT